MNDSPLKVVTLNCQSITRKKAILDNLIQEYTPDIITGTESWLNPTISSTEIFSSNFAVFRQDRICQKPSTPYIPLKRLSCKLSYYGICGCTLKWIENLLTGRSQQVVVNGEYSDPTTVISGVPQGSVLGPLLFLCYINDITQNLTSKVRLYADDTLIYRNILNEQDVVALQDLNTIMKWSVDWQMTFNPSKSEFLRITNKVNYISSDYYLRNCHIPLVNHVKYLGVIIEKHLNWSDHVNMITAKANSVRGFL